MTAVRKAGRRMNPNRTDKWYAYAMISPIVLGFLIFLLFPLFYEAWLSLTDTKLMGDSVFVGMANYNRLLFGDRHFSNSLKNTLIFTTFVVLLNVSSAIVLAVMLNKKLKGIGIYRTLVFMPNITPVVVWAIVWKFILASDIGVLNSLLRRIGIEGPAWLYSLQLTMPVLIVNTVMKGVGLNMVMFLSALKSIPEVYYEAASIDGARGMRQFFYITLPLLSPTIFMIVVTTIIGAMKVFANVYALTGGGPARRTQVLVLFIYDTAFRKYEFGYAAAVSMIMFLILLILTVFQWTIRRKLVYAEN